MAAERADGPDHPLFGWRLSLPQHHVEHYGKNIRKRWLAHLGLDEERVSKVRESRRFVSYKHFRPACFAEKQAEDRQRRRLRILAECHDKTLEADLVERKTAAMTETEVLSLVVPDVDLKSNPHVRYYGTNVRSRWLAHLGLTEEQVAEVSECYRVVKAAGHNKSDGEDMEVNEKEAEDMASFRKSTSFGNFGQDKWSVARADPSSRSGNLSPEGVHPKVTRSPFSLRESWQWLRSASLPSSFSSSSFEDDAVTNTTSTAADELLDDSGASPSLAAAAVPSGDGAQKLMPCLCELVHGSSASSAPRGKCREVETADGPAHPHYGLRFELPAAHVEQYGLKLRSRWLARLGISEAQIAGVPMSKRKLCYAHFPEDCIMGVSSPWSSAAPASAAPPAPSSATSFSDSSSLSGASQVGASPKPMAQTEDQLAPRLHVLTACDSNTLPEDVVILRGPRRRKLALVVPVPVNAARRHASSLVSSPKPDAALCDPETAVKHLFALGAATAGSFDRPIAP
ncbi:Hypothetical Protein FCC1311_020852 [Hondaea fermentalgiana]|uniref:Uncharacterized protein n=1 Tax=Hondaea fermentalgiana TaxID=2315210 RepID=A0A2R5G4B9_9STRA|nr:Hypothetical Protein FCC1311_020852 [Hondaea fermentalgiana]|eukprot:GBG25866.1 Hypothetical Protein FCC1311_020852 [Hondaea fermentalgiana]